MLNVLKGLLDFVFNLIRKIVTLLSSSSQQQTTTTRDPEPQQKNTNHKGKDELLKAALDGSFKTQRLLNQTETKVFFHIIKLISTMDCNMRCFPQVSCGEFIYKKDKQAHDAWFRYVNPKRVDFGIFDRNFNPIAVVEVQGKGHKKSNFWALNDATKLALSNDIGIKFIQVRPDEEGELDRLREELLDLKV